MTIKELAFSTQRLLEASTGALFKRAHIYELLAASFGFNSYAALCADSVFTEQSLSSRRSSSYALPLQIRCTEIGYLQGVAEVVAKVLPPFLTDREIGVIRLPDLVAHLRFESGRQYDYPDDEDEDDWNESIDDRLGDLDALASPVLMDGLTIAADKGNAEAHYALALILSAEENGLGENEVGSGYWHQQAQAGRMLSSIERDFADAHVARIARADRYLNHLREAARLGHQSAMLELADRFNDPTFFEQSEAHVETDPSRVAEIAEKLGRSEDAKKWLTKAAISGDTEAMRRLIEYYDQNDLQQCWTWIYLAKLVGTDLTKGQYHAIHEDGSPYDDDIGGNLFVDGRDGVSLRPIGAEQDASARRAAQEIFERMDRSAD